MTALSDLEITRLCAEAMGLPVATEESWARYAKGAHECWVHMDKERDGSLYRYRPLHDDAQAMALVKKVGVHCSFDPWDVAKPWQCAVWRDTGWLHSDRNIDLNRAICLCVAAMQAKPYQHIA